MKTVLAVACFLAAASVVRGIDQDEIIGKYMEYLQPDLKPCADEFHFSEDQISNIQTAGSSNLKQMGCLKACVMKRMSILTDGNVFHLEPIYKMIDTVHAGNDADIQFVKKIAVDCHDEIKGEADECNIGDKYTDCYIEKLFNQ